MEWIESIAGHFRTVYRLRGNRKPESGPRPQCRSFVTEEMKAATGRRVVACRGKVIVSPRGGR